MAEVELDKIILHFAQSNKAEGKSSKTINWYTDMLTGFTRFLAASCQRSVLDEFNVVSVREFIIHEQDRGLSPYTVHGKVRALKCFASWLLNEGYTPEHVLQNLKPPKVPVNLIEPLTDKEIEQLLSCQNQLTALGCRNISILVTLLDTGLRLSELCMCRYEDAHIDDGYLKAMGFDGTSIIYNLSDNIDDLWSGDADRSSLWIMMHSLRDPSQAPEGMATVQITTPFPYKYMCYWKREVDGIRGKEYREALANKLIASAEAVIPQLSQHIVCKDIATPLTFERYTLNSEGASSGWFPLPGAGMRSQKTAIKNLYQAGHWTFPAGSISAVALSGRNAAKLVLKESKHS